MSRFRNFCFTHNNYDNTGFEDSLDCQYIIYGKEIGVNGTPHLQGYVRFKNAKTLKAVIKIMKPRHVEICQGTPQQNIEYCKKEGDWTERGEPPLTPMDGGDMEKRRWEDAFKAAEEGRLDDIDPQIRFCYDLNIERIHKRAKAKKHLEDTESQHYWFYGPSGTGKSREARAKYPGAYIKLMNKWWCGYEDEEAVIIDDVDIRHEKLCYHLKIWADRYPFRAEVKGSSMMIRPKVIVVTSNYHPSQIWTNPSDCDPILRRFKCVHFNKK